MKVARLYRFRARHSLPGVPGYDHEHEHNYTVEVVAEGGTNEGGMVVDTAAIDDVVEPVCADLEGTNLNDEVSPSTVENLAQWFRALVDTDTGELDCVCWVTVWEDDDRWGRSEA